MLARIMLCSLIALGISSRSQAQGRPESESGYVDFRELDDWFDTEAKLEINVKGALLRLVAEASRNEDPELARLLSRLKGIYVRGYPLSRSQAGAVGRRTSDFARRLEGQGWDTVVRVREEDEQVDMYIRSDGDNIAGLVVMVVSPDEDETIFVNIVGDIDPEEIGRIGSKFHIDALDRPEIGERRK